MIFLPILIMERVTKHKTNKKSSLLWLHGSYPANFVAIAGIPTHHLHESLAIALNNSQVLSLQFGETIFWGREPLPHCFPC